MGKAVVSQSTAGEARPERARGGAGRLRKSELVCRSRAAAEAGPTAGWVPGHRRGQRRVTGSWHEQTENSSGEKAGEIFTGSQQLCWLLAFSGESC